MNKEIKFKFDWLLWFLILLPTFYIVNKDLRHVQMNFFQISIVLMLAVLLVNRWFGMFLAWATFQVVFFPDVNGKVVLLQNIFFAGILYHFVVKYVFTFKRYFWVFFGLLAVNVAWAFLQTTQYDPVFSMANPQNAQNPLIIFAEFPGFFGIPAFLGIFTAAVIPICLSLCPWLGLVALPALFFSKSSFAILAGASGALFYLWYRKRIVFWGAIILFLVAGGLYIVKYDAPTGQFDRRGRIWKLILNESFKKQFFGHGLGSYGTKYKFLETSPNHLVAMALNNREVAVFFANSALSMGKKDVADFMVGKNINEIDFEEAKRIAHKNEMDLEVWDSTHNEFIQVFFELGGIGLFILLGYIFSMLKRFFLIRKKDVELIALASGFIAICIVSFAHFPFHVARLAGPFIVLMALFETKLLRSEDAL